MNFFLMQWLILIKTHIHRSTLGGKKTSKLCLEFWVSYVFSFKKILLITKKQNKTERRLIAGFIVLKML